MGKEGAHTDGCHTMKQAQAERKQRQWARGIRKGFLELKLDNVCVPAKLRGAGETGLLDGRTTKANTTALGRCRLRNPRSFRVAIAQRGEARTAIAPLSW